MHHQHWNRLEKKTQKTCTTLALIHLDQLPLSSLVLFIHFIIHMTEEKHRWTNADLSVLAVFPQLGCLARMQAHLVSAVSTGMGKVPHRPGSPTPPFFLLPRFHTPFSPFEEFVFQTGNKHTCTWPQVVSTARRCDGDVAARSSVSFSVFIALTLCRKPSEAKHFKEVKVKRSKWHFFIFFCFVSVQACHGCVGSKCDCSGVKGGKVERWWKWQIQKYAEILKYR